MSTLPDSFRLIFQDSPLGVAVVLNTTDGTLDNAMLLYANPALLKLIRHKSPDNYDFVSVIREFCVDEEGQTLLPLSDDPHDTKSLFSRIDIPGEKTLWAEVRTQPTSIMGERAHFFWFTDVTETKEQETIAKREAAKADAAAQAKSAFLATMSHEIRTPMQTIFGMLELMKDEESQERLNGMIGSAQNSANSLLGILDDILDLAKVDAGKMELDAFEIPIRVLVNGLIASMESKRRENNLYLKAEFSDDVPDIIIGDPKRLRQIFTNLISNGLKFTEHGGVTVRITTQPHHVTATDNDIPLRIEVVDTGIGMTHETASRLFQPFTQADNSTTRKFGGTGLGLSIAHRLVELMGGEIGVTSKMHEGSVFWFEIPTLKAENHTYVDLPDLTGMSILVVEDYPVSQAELQTTLQHMKADVMIAASAAEALELTEKRPFDVVLVDYGLPDSDGISLLKKIHALRPFAGMVLHTIQNDYAILQSCKLVGARYLEKPASRVAIGEAIRSAAMRVRPQSNKPQRLLICEDNESVRDILQRQLTKLGVEADFAEDGAAGWDIIQKNIHTVVITDLHMPIMDGYGLAKTVRDYEHEHHVTNGDRLPVIAMTADVQLVHEQVYLQHGFDECLLKPVSLGQLKQLLTRWGVICRHETPPTSTTEASAPIVEIVTDQAVNVVETPAEPVAASDEIILPNQPVIDQEMAVDQFGAFDEDAIDMIRMFIKITIPQVSEMDEAFKNSDWLRLRNIAHSVKGAARSACCLQLGDVAENIQITADGGVVQIVQMKQLHAAFGKAQEAASSL